MLGAFSPGDTSIPMDYSGGEYWDPNGGGMVELNDTSWATNTSTIAPSSVASSSLSFLTNTFQLGALAVPVWLPLVAFGLFFVKGGRS